jgi:hypothetical protein
MLTRSESQRIRREGLSTTHDYWFNSLFAGEPFVQDGLIVYYDGRIVSLCAFPMRNTTKLDAVVCRQIAHRWVSERGAEGVIFVGPRSVDFAVLAKLGLRKTWEEKPRRISAELFIDCSDRERSAFNRRLFRRSRALGFEVCVRTGGIISAEHFRLVERFYAERQLTAYLAEVAFVLPAVLRSEKVRIIEARQAGYLHGFVAMHKPFCDTAIGLFMMCNQQVPGVSDFLYSVMLEQAYALGASYLNVGPSPSSGHFNFKLKWGGEPKVPPYYFVQWGRGHLSRRFHTSWGPRILRL